MSTLNEKLVVLDISDNSVSIYNLKESESTTDTETLLTSRGHDIDNCSMMYCTGNVNIHIE